MTVVRVGAVGVPQIAGHPSADAALRSRAAGLQGSCPVVTERDDPAYASFRWNCPGGVEAATVDLRTDRLLALGDLLQGSWAGYLAGAAAAQLEADGLAHPATASPTAWYLTPEALEAAYPAGVVGFPLASLAPYLRRSDLA